MVKKKTTTKKKTTAKKVKTEVPEDQIFPPEKKRHTKALIELGEKEIKQIEYASGLGLKMNDISALLGFSRATLFRIADRDPRVEEAIDRGKSKAASKVMQTLFELATSGKSAASTMFWLKTQMKWREIHPEDDKKTNEIVFRTKIGEGGQIISEQIEDGVKTK